MIYTEYVLYLFVLITAVNYLALVIYLTTGWFKVKAYHYSPVDFHTKVSILVPFRNEEDHLPACILSIVKQDFPSHLMEIVLIDDHSTDSSLESVLKFKEINAGFNIRIIELKNIYKDKGSKKLAIKEGIALSGGELIITTDADCQMHPSWLKNIVSYYEKHQPKMIVAPVIYMNDQSFFGRLQHLEFLSLQSVGASSIGVQHPIMANGANFVFKKDIFHEVRGYEGNEHIASGDDVFLLHQFHRKYPGTVHFIKSYEAVVFTLAPLNVAGFINQRKRWASKSKNYNDVFAGYVAISVFLLCFFMVLCLLISPFSKILLCLFIFTYLAKMLVDLPLLFEISRFAKKSSLLFWVPFLALLYPFYVVFIGIYGYFGTYTWKDRRIN